MKIKIINLNLIEFMIFISMIVLLTFNALPPSLWFLKYIDEAISLVMFYFLLTNVKKWSTIKENRLIIISLLILVAVGILYNMYSKIIPPFSAIIVDAFGIVKNHIIFVTIIFGVPNAKMHKIIRALIPLIKLYIIIIFLFGVINFFLDIGMSNGIRYGVRAYQFLFTNPAMVGITMIVCIAFLDYVHYKGIIRYLAFISMIMTLRAVVCMSIVIYVAITLFFKFSKKIRWYHVMLLLIIGLFIGWQMVGEFYIVDEQSNRFLLLKYGYVVFKRYFPFGSGFASYGSQMAYTYYSPLYREFGFLNHWGLNLTYGGTANDNFWPMIIAQFGVIGIIIIGLVLYNELYIVNCSTTDKFAKRGVLLIFFSLLFSTLASADLTGIAGTIRYLGLAIIVRALLYEKNNENFLIFKYKIR